MLPNESQIAFKEWAVTVDALAQGQQVLLLRKGGIHEVTKDFRVAHPEFLLYPTYEHQQEDLLKPASQPLLQQTLMHSHAPDTVTFSYWAQVTETIKVAEPEKVQEYSKYHIWPNEYTDARLRWKPPRRRHLRASSWRLRKWSSRLGCSHRIESSDFVQKFHDR